MALEKRLPVLLASVPLLPPSALSCINLPRNLHLSELKVILPSDSDVGL